MDVFNKEHNSNDIQSSGDNNEDPKMMERDNRSMSDEPMAIDDKTEDAEGTREVSNSGQLLQTPSPIQMTSPLVHVKKEGNDGKGQVQFEFYFPEEIWLMILALLDDQDRVNCCRALPYLDSISTVDKPVFLAKEVLTLMDGWLNKNELLGCRKVCKKWNAGVDQLMYSKRADTCTRGADCLYHFERQEELERFALRFAGHPRSPFIDGTVHFVDTDEDLEYPDVALELVRDFGKHIRNLIIEDFCGASGPFNWYRFLQKALEKTPNLRQLRIVEEGLTEYDAQPRLREILDLNTSMIERPIPFIQHLDFLSINVKGVVTTATQNVSTMLILPHGSQLKTLSIQMPYWQDHYAARLVGITNLTVLSLKSGVNLRRLGRLANSLETLSLHASGSLRVGVLFQVLQRLPNLQELSICLCNISNRLMDGRDISTMRNLTVPSVRTLKIMFGGTRSYNFLELFSGLRDLFICIDDDMDTEQLPNENEDGDLKIFEIVQTEEIYESNMWELIPALEKAVIRYKLRADAEWRNAYGTREGHVEYAARN